MADVTELFDDLVAIRRTAQAFRHEISKESRDDLQVVLGRVEAKLRAELCLLDEEEREEVIESLDDLYGNEAREELEALLWATSPTNLATASGRAATPCMAH